MRLIYTLPLITGLALAACGDSGTVEDPANNPEGVANAMANLPKPEAGEYQTTGELVEFEVPGMAEDEIEMARTFMAAMFTEPQSQCITAEEAEEGYEGMIGDMGQDNEACEMTAFNATSDGFNATMNCDDGQGNVGSMTYEGQVTSTSMDATMTVDGNDPNMGSMRMVVRMQTERVGECAA